MPRLALAVALACVAGAGCTHMRSVTPWLRTTRYEPFELFAESGQGAHASTSITVQRRVNGTWYELDAHSDYAFAYAADTRAVLGDAILAEDGRTIDFTCAGTLRAPHPERADGELVCVDVHEDENAGSSSVTVSRYDRDGTPLDRRTVAWPIHPPRASVFYPMVDLKWLGFGRSGLVFSVFVADEGDSFAGDALHACAAYALDGDGWHGLGRLVFRMGALWKCNFARPWNETGRFAIEPGAYLRGSDGQPDP